MSEELEESQPDGGTQRRRAMVAGPGIRLTSIARDGSRTVWNGVTTMTKPNARSHTDPSETDPTAAVAREEEAQTQQSGASLDAQGGEPVREHRRAQHLRCASTGGTGAPS